MTNRDGHTRRATAPAADQAPSGLTRRALVGAAAAGALGLAGAVRALQELAASDALAAAAPADDVRATMAAFADTIVPGPAGGAHAAPGALEVGALEELYDPFYGVAEVFPALHADLQAATPRVLGRPARFDLRLPYSDRERVVADRIAEPARGGGNALQVAHQAAAVLVYLTFAGTARGDGGLRYMGFPPASDGYWPRHSHRVAFRGMTRDGNPS